MAITQSFDKTTVENRFVVNVKGSLPNHLMDWADHSQIQLTDSASNSEYELRYHQQKLMLYWLGEERFSPICVEMPNSYRLASSNLLFKAIGKKTQTIVDLTAGMGVDTLTMATRCSRVYCVERCAPVALLLFDGISRCTTAIAEKIELSFCDSLEWLKLNSRQLDSIYIDTMFADKKTTAKSPKAMQILRKLAGHDEDANKLVEQALNQDVKRVVVKNSDGVSTRSKQTMAQYAGKTVRYDVFKAKA